MIIFIVFLFLVFILVNKYLPKINNFFFSRNSIIEQFQTEIENLINGTKMYFSYYYTETEEDYIKWLKLLPELEKNIKFYDKVKGNVSNKFIDLYQPELNKNFHKFFHENVSEVLRKTFGVDNDMRGILSPFQNKVQNEFQKCVINLKGERLKLISTEKYHILVNKFGFIFVELKDPFLNNKKYEMLFTIPLEFIDKIEFISNDSIIEYKFNLTFYRKILEKLERKNELKNIVFKLVNFNNQHFKKKYIFETYLYKVIKENNFIELSDLINLMYENYIISLNEYLINVELGEIEFDLDYVLNLIFEYKYIGSFFSKKKDHISIAESTKKILKIEDVKNYYLKSYLDKNDFYEKTKIKGYINNINFEFLRNPKNYKVIFGFINNWVYDKNDFVIKNLLKNPKSPTLLSIIENEIRKTENELRNEKGFRIVGTRVSEHVLYQKLLSIFPSEEVISQGKPNWLGKQSLDIYFPIHNIGIEFQGEQHFKPIDFFGGEEKFNKQVKLDIKKRELCKINKCVLIEVKEGYDLDELILKIQNCMIK